MFDLMFIKIDFVLIDSLKLIMVESEFKAKWFMFGLDTFI